MANSPDVVEKHMKEFIHNMKNGDVRKVDKNKLVETLPSPVYRAAWLSGNGAAFDVDSIESFGASFCIQCTKHQGDVYKEFCDMVTSYFVLSDLS